MGSDYGLGLGLLVKILIACEFSGTVREAFTKLGHDVTSCDIEPTDIPGKHYQGDVNDIINDGWDMMIAFPPCTYLCVSGARWFKDRKPQQENALDFVHKLMCSDIPKICIENPVGVISTRIKKPDQIIQPYEYGHGETKKTCLWLKNLPKLKPTNIVEGRENRIHKMAPSKNRGKLRSITYDGIAEAMAKQWGNLI